LASETNRLYYVCTREFALGRVLSYGPASGVRADELTCLPSSTGTWQMVERVQVGNGKNPAWRMRVCTSLIRVCRFPGVCGLGFELRTGSL
jgi:hypothetical protein